MVRPGLNLTLVEGMSRRNLMPLLVFAAIIGLVLIGKLVVKRPWEEMRLRALITFWINNWPSVGHRPQKILSVSNLESGHEEIRFNNMSIIIPPDLKAEEVDDHIEFYNDLFIASVFKPRLETEGSWMFSRKDWSEMVNFMPASKDKLSEMTLGDLTAHLGMIRKKISAIPKDGDLYYSLDVFGKLNAVFIRESEGSFNGFLWINDTTLCIPVHWRLNGKGNAVMSPMVLDVFSGIKMVK